MKVMSFDVGIKNMAYCILSKTDEIRIDDWNVLNLMNEEVNQTFQCNCIIPARTKKQTDKLCGKKAKYDKNGSYYCEKHAKSNKDFILPTKQTTMSYLKKQKVQTLINICHSHLLCIDNGTTKMKKDDFLKVLETFYTTKCLCVLNNIKKKSASEVDLLEVGRNMKRLINAIPNIQEITHVVIENQISPIANRMKTIQGMLAQYFIMINENIVISFVSSSHKLKQFNDINILYEKIENQHSSYKPKNNPNYKENKLGGVFYCNKILQSNYALQQWTEKMNTKKKDDLADSFLQGLWHFKQHNIISYADDLKIKIV
jgi:hypothetical protein